MLLRNGAEISYRISAKLFFADIKALSAEAWQNSAMSKDSNKDSRKKNERKM
jgi:hypothetical protein